MFPCDKCGLCCRVDDIPEMRQHDRGDGYCKFLNADNLCTIYDNRPSICRVDSQYQNYKNEMTLEEYYELSQKACKMLKERYGKTDSSK